MMKENPSDPPEASHAGDGMTDEEKREKKEWLDKFAGRKAPEAFSDPREGMSKEEWVDEFTGSENSKRAMGTKVSLESLAEKSGNGTGADVPAEADGSKWVDDFAGRLPGGEAKTGKEMSLKALAENAEKGAFVSKDNKSDTGKEKKESPEEILARLEAEVGASRTAYAAKSHEMSGNLASWKRFLRIEKTNADDLAKGTYEYARYQESVKRLVDWKLETAKEKYHSLTPYQQMQKSKEIEAELEGIYRYANLDEKVNLYSAYADAKQMAKAKDRDGRKLTIKEKALDFGEKAVNWYRKLPTKYKVAISVSLLAGGIAAGTMGAASVASAVGIAKVAQRLAGGAAAGVGMVGTQEQARRWMERREAAKGWKRDKKGIEADLLRGTPEELFNRVSAVCDNEIASLNDNLAKELKRSGGRKVIGFAVGTIVGSGALAHAAKAFGGVFSHHTSPDVAKSAAKLAASHHGLSEAAGKAAAAGGGSLTQQDIPDGSGSVMGRDPFGNVIKPGPGADEIYGKLVENDAKNSWNGPSGTGVASAAETGSVHQGGTELSVGKGGSLEGTVKHHLMERGMDKAAAGREAHRLALEYAKQHGLTKGAPSLVHEGTRIHLGPDGKIIGVGGDKHLGWIEKDASGHKHFAYATPDQRMAAGMPQASVAEQASGTGAANQGMPNPDQGVKVASAEKLSGMPPAGVALEVRGSDMEKAIADRLTLQGMDRNAAKAAAHDMFDRFSSERGLPKIHSLRGVTGVQLSPDGRSITGISGKGNMGFIGEDSRGMRRYFPFDPEQRATMAPHVAQPEAGTPQHGPEHGPEAHRPAAGSRMPGAAKEAPASVSGVAAEGPIGGTVPYESMTEEFRKGFGEIDERFGLTQYVNADIEKCREITARMDALAAESRQAVGQYKDLPDLRVRLADIDNRLNSFEPGVVDPMEEELVGEKIKLESTIKILEDKNVAFNELRERHKHYFAKVAAGLRRVMFGEDTKISGDPQQIVNMSAKEFLNDPTAIGREEKIIGIYQSLAKLPGGQVFEPKAGESMASWTRRIMLMLMDSKKMKPY